MTTFFEQEDRARRNTRLLVWLMVLAIIGMGLSIYAVAVFVGLFFGPRGPAQVGPFPFFQPELFLVCFGGTAALVAIASASRVLSLRGGGAHFAEMLGGRLISGQPRDILERRLLNVVEEMAIASGVPVPQVFALDDEPGINAFAAGYSTDDAVVAVTRGSLEKLSRDELQGVIAHEFSHVLNGDMRLNMRMMGIIFGILCIGLLGRFLMRISFGSGRSDRRSSPAAVLIFFALSVYLIGIVGEFFGKLIKAAVSRQREFLADASAVQFTRNPQGIAGALKKIGGLDVGSSVTSGHAEEASHFFFGNVHPDIYNRLWVPGLLATHPALRERIARVDPSFHGEFPKVGPGVAEPEDRPAAPVASFAQATRTSPTPQARSVAPHTVVGRVGTASVEGLDTSRRLVDSLPVPLRDAVENPFAACAIVYALLLSDDAAIQQAQGAQIDALSSAGLRAETLRVYPLVCALARRDRLPLVYLLAPALRRLSRQQRAAFSATVQAMIDADRAVSIFEYVLVQTLSTRLAEDCTAQQRSRVRHNALDDVKPELQLLLSLLAHAGDTTGESAAHALRAGAVRLLGVDLALLPTSPRLLSGLGVALEELAALTPPLRAHVVDACAHTVLADGQMTDDEETLLRAVCDALGSPLPLEDSGREAVGDPIR